LKRIHYFANVVEFRCAQSTSVSNQLYLIILRFSLRNFASVIEFWCAQFPTSRIDHDKKSSGSASDISPMWNYFHVHTLQPLETININNSSVQPLLCQ
jgi:hypothetical protein